ncbi:MAG TPA: hypothetical protein VG742_16815 [Dongiaceae bacterium]|nr:hypothetical protein [Dongiaceae bacterium]
MMSARGSIIGVPVLAVCFGSMAATPALADVERVALLRVATDGSSAIIQRKNDEIWTIEVGNGCPAIDLYERRWVTIEFDGFLDGVGSQLILREDGQSCQIWDADRMQ